MFTAIVLGLNDAFHAWQHALHLDLIPAGWKEHCHHVTLAMGKGEGFTLGERRKLTVTHYGVIEGRVCAFRVQGAEDSKNKVPHITIATHPDAKPREGNDIAEWVPVPDPFPLWGEVQQVPSV